MREEHNYEQSLQCSVIIRVKVQVKKGKFLYCAVSSPQDHSKRFTLYFPDRPVHSAPSRLLWEASSHMLQLMREGYSYTYPPLSIVRYSFIQLSELEQCRVKKLAQGFNTTARIRTRVHVVESTKLYPWATSLYLALSSCRRPPSAVMTPMACHFFSWLSSKVNVYTKALYSSDL